MQILTKTAVEDKVSGREKIEAIYSEDPFVFFWVVEKSHQTDDPEKELVILTDQQIQELVDRGNILRKQVPEKRKCRHFRNGKIYTIKGLVINPETFEIFVWYQAEYYSEKLKKDKVNWAKPIELFFKRFMTMIMVGQRGMNISNS